MHLGRATTEQGGRPQWNRGASPPAMRLRSGTEEGARPAMARAEHAAEHSHGGGGQGAGCRPAATRAPAREVKEDGES
jgi:hypothetical protein